MSTVTVRPNATLNVGDSSLDGAASRWAALSDNSDSSDVQFNYDMVSVNSCRLGFPNPTIPAGARVKSIAIRARSLLFAANAIGLNANLIVAGSYVIVGYQAVGWTAYTTSTIASHAQAATPTGIEVHLSVQTPAIPGGAVLLSELYVDTVYVVQPAVSVAGPTGTLTTTNLPTITWADTLDSAGGAQVAYEVKVFDAGTYGAGGFDPAISTPVAQSGIQSGTDASWRVGDEADESLPNDTYKAYVRAAQTVNGTVFWSPWAVGSAFDVDVPMPAGPGLTAAPDDANARIRIDVTANAGDAETNFFQVQRSVDAGETWGNVRALLNDGEILRAYELCTNPTFATDTAGWANEGMSTFEMEAGVTTSPAGTTTALHFANDASGEYFEYAFAAVDGADYDVTMNLERVLSTAGDNLRIGIYDAAGMLVAQSGAPVSGTAWQPLGVSFTADSTGTWTLRVTITHVGAGSGGSEWYMTDVSILQSPDQFLYDYEVANGVPALVSYRARALHDFADGGRSVSDWSEVDSDPWESTAFWLKHPTRPSLNVALALFSPATSGIQRAGRQGRFQAVGSTEAVLVTDTRTAESGTIRFRCDTDEERDALVALLDTLDPLLFQPRATDHEPDRWLVFGDEARERLVDKAWVEGVWEELPWVSIPVPAGNLVELE